MGIRMRREMRTRICSSREPKKGELRRQRCESGHKHERERDGVEPLVAAGADMTTDKLNSVCSYSYQLSRL